MITDFNNGKRNSLLFLAVLLVILALFFNIGIYPLYLEEPRRALIALEMLFNGNWWVPTEFGEYYYKKPPLFNWVLLLSYSVFGNYSELATRFPSIICYLATAWFIYLFGKLYVNRTFGVFTSLLFIICSDTLFYFTLVGGEIDLFYTLITFLSFMCIFHFDQRNEFYKLFVFTYLLGALGTLTKGLPSLVFLGLSIGGYFIYKKDWKRLISLPHLTGLMVYSLIVGGYLFIYHQYNSITAFFGADRSVLDESMDRTFLNHGLWEFISSFLSFPVMLIKVMAPGSLLVLFLFKRGVLGSIKAQSYIQFSLLLFLLNIAVYWISPGTSSRYIYMLFPLLLNVFFYAFYQSGAESLTQTKILDWIFKILLIAFVFACGSLAFIPELRDVPMIYLVSIGGVFFFSILLLLYLRFYQLRLYVFILAVLGLRVVFGATILPVRATSGSGFQEKNLASEIVSEVGDEPLKLYKEARPSRTTIFYLERDLGRVVNYDSSENPNWYYLALTEELQGKSVDFLLEFEFKNKKYALVRF